MSGSADRAATAERAARAGAAVALASFRQHIDVETKSGKNDVVTQADRDAQARVREVIHETFPGETVVGEEGDGRKSMPDSGPVWVVDPIDGTANYVRGIQTWGTSVAAVVDGEAVAAANVFPAFDDVYVADGDGAALNGGSAAVSGRDDPETFVVVPTTWWPRNRRSEYAAEFARIVERFGDARRYGCSQISLSMLASGQVDGVISNRRSHPWDTVAGVFMIRQAGGTVTNPAGEPWSPDDDGLVASNGRAHEDLLEAARDIKRTRAETRE